MKNIIITILTGISLLALVACSEDTWVEIKLEGTEITASFPSEPSIKSKSMTLPGLGEVTVTQASFSDEDITYSVNAMEMLDSQQEFNEENMAPHAMLNKGASLGDTNSVYLGSLSGKEYKMNIRDRSVIQRMFVDSNKMYTFIAIFKDSSSENAERFLDSVRL